MKLAKNLGNWMLVAIISFICMAIFFNEPNIPIVVCSGAVFFVSVIVCGSKIFDEHRFDD